jgi:hypothetical protein
MRDMPMDDKNTRSKGNVEPPPPPPEEEENREDQAEQTYFFHPIQLSNENEEILDEKEIEKAKSEVEQELQEVLKSISEEALQLSEFLIEENTVTTELCMSLKQILKKLNVCFNIPPQDLPLRRKVKKVVLNEEGILIVVHEKGDVTSSLLSEYSPEIVMAVLCAVLPELARVVSLYRKKLSTRVNFFGRLRKELKSVAKAIATTEEENASSEEEQTMDVVKDSVKQDMPR